MSEDQTKRLVSAVPYGHLDYALAEARYACETIDSGIADSYSLSPQPAEVRPSQHRIAEQQCLIAVSEGCEPHRRVRIRKQVGA